MKNENYLTFIAIIVAGLIIGGAIIISGNDFSVDREIVEEDQEREVIEEEEEVVEEAERVDMDNIELDGWPSLGDSEAPVVMVEYSDFACPFCGRFFEETLPDIKENYIDTGEVHFVYKDLVVVGGDKAAEAAHCAGEQDSFWEYHDLLFENLEEDRGNWSDPDIHASYSRELGLDEEDLVTCFEEGRYVEKVQNSTEEAIGLEITGTPGFVINGEVVRGAQPYEVFEEIIERELNR